MTCAWRRWSLSGLVVIGALLPSAVSAGIIPWPWAPKCPPQRMSQRQAEREACFAQRGSDPIGSRQVNWHGKQWPPYPRPTGPANLPSHLFHAEHYWPHPYVCDDRDYVRAISAAQTSNGWVTMTTLYEYHFEPETHQLNAAGRTQLRWILENAPARHRYAFVQSAVDQASSEMRLQAARNEAMALVGGDQVPPILLRVTSPLGRPAEEINAIRVRDRETILSPRITPPIGTNNLGASEASGS